MKKSEYYCDKCNKNISKEPIHIVKLIEAGYKYCPSIGKKHLCCDCFRHIRNLFK